MKKFFLKATFSNLQRQRFYNKIAMYLHEGIPALNAIGFIETRLRRRKDLQADMYKDIMTKIEKGVGTVEALQYWIPDSERMMIEAGTVGKQKHPEIGFRQAAKLASELQRIRNILTSGLVYPVFLIIAMIFVLAFLSYNLMPKLKALTDFGLWPNGSKNLYYLSNFIAHFGVFLLLSFVGLVVLFVATLNTWTGEIRTRFDRFFPYSIYREYHSASFLLCLSSMLLAQVPINEAITRIASISSNWLTWHLKKVLTGLRQGKTKGAALDTGLFNNEIAGDIQDIGNLTSFESAINEYGVIAIEESIKQIQKITTFTRNVLLVFIALLILWIYTSFRQITGAIKTHY